jgi:hypothetical protein
MLEQYRARARRLQETITPEAKERRNRHFIENEIWHNGNASQPKGSESRLRAGRSITAHRLGWCPPELRDDYYNLVRRKHFSADEARALIEQQHETEMARWRRKFRAASESRKPANDIMQIAHFMPLADRAIALVCNATGFTPADLRGKSRHRDLVRGRWIIYNVLSAAGRSQPTIARVMGRTDHTAVSHALRQTQAWCWHDPLFADLLDDVMRQCAPMIEAAKEAARQRAA